jgi:uncharacterized membrane protein
MKPRGLKRIFFRGMALAFPLAVMGYIFIRIVVIFQKTIQPVAIKLGVQRVLGAATLTIFAILLILLVILVLGLLMQFSGVSIIRQQLEDTIMKFIPSLNHLKALEADNIDLENSQTTWKPILLLFEQKYSAAFIIEENGDFITLFVSKGTNLKQGEILTTNKKDVILIPASFQELHKYSKAYGKGYISLIARAIKS